MLMNEAPTEPTYFDIFDGKITTYTAPRAMDPVIHKAGEFLIIRYRWLEMKKWALPDEDVLPFIVAAHEFICENLA